MRLDKLLSHVGVTSRRHAKQYVRDGRITVNGSLPESPGTPVDPSADRVCVDGQPVQMQHRPIYLALHKPTGYVSTASDDRNRPTVLDLVPERLGRVYPIGRLDLNSEGLLLLTNDGELTHRLIHPRYHVPKTYHVWVEGQTAEADLQRLRDGVEIEDGTTAPAQVSVLRRSHHGMELEFVLYEGRKRQIRRMCHAVGQVVTRLIRVQFGPIPLGNLQSGTWRKLSQEEIHQLRHAAGMER